MRLKKYALALATTAALAGAGMTVPNALAQNDANADTNQTAPEPVEGFSWPNVEVVAGGTVEIKPSKTPSDDYRFVGPADGAGYTFTTDQKTGVVTAKAPVNGFAGQSVQIPIQVHKLNADKTKYELVDSYTSTITIKEGGNNNANTYQVSYDELKVVEGKSATAQRKGNVPEGTTFSIEDKSDHLTASVDQNGNVTVTPGEKVGAGSTAYAAVKITYPDTSYEYASFKVTVTDAEGNATPHADRDVAKYDPTWESPNMRGDATATAKQTATVPANTKFTILEDLVPKLKENFTYSIDASGAVTLTPKAPIAKGQKIEVPVEIAYPDGTSEQKIVTFNVTEDGQWQSQKAQIAYPEIKTPADKAGTSTPNKSNVPDGTTFEFAGAGLEGWEIAVDKSSGELRAKAPTNSRAGLQLKLPVRATFPDTSTKMYEVPFTTTDPEQKLADAHTVTYQDLTITAGQPGSVTPTIEPAAPEGTTFSGPNQDSDGLKLTTNEKTGEITAQAQPDKSGSGTIPVTVRFPDGTEKKVEFTLTLQPEKKPTPPSSTTAAPAPSTTSTTSKTEPTPTSTTSEKPTSTTSTKPSTSEKTTTPTTSENKPTTSTKETTPTSTTSKTEPTPTSTTSEKPTTTSEKPTTTSEKPTTTTSTSEAAPTETSTATATETTTATTTVTPPKDGGSAQSSDKDNNGGSAEGSSPAGIAGIIIGVLALLGGIGAAIFWFMQNNGGFPLPF